MSQYTLADFETVEQPSSWRCPACDDEVYDTYESAARHHMHCSDDDAHFLHDYYGEQLSAAYKMGRSTNELADKLGVDSKTVTSALDSLEVETRNTTTATKLWFETLCQEEQERVIYEGQEAAAKALSDWRDKNSDKHRKNAIQNLPDSPSGPESHSWRGGKCLRDNLTLTYGKESWASQREQSKQSDNYTCTRCGVQKEGIEIHSHHIVPVLAGGTNHPDNLMTVCNACHRSIEDFTWSIPEVIPVFTDQ